MGQVISMLRSLSDWRRRRVLQRYPLADNLWISVAEPMSLLQGLTVDELQRLRDLTTLFLHEKHFFGAREFPVNEEMKLQIAIQACLLILNLDLTCYRGWSSIIIYPDSFIVRREETDEAGIVHAGRDILAGESWEDGPVVISWADCGPDAHPYGADTNVVIHEFAHKLDMNNGVANGMPPLHMEMEERVWTATFAAAYEVTIGRMERDEDTVIDPYGAEDPAEFFAVVSECFFEAPWLLAEEFPALYRQLVLYYRQDPAVRRVAPAGQVW
jgi:MtfA peptidase